ESAIGGPGHDHARQSGEGGLGPLDPVEVSDLVLGEGPGPAGYELLDGALPQPEGGRRLAVQPGDELGVVELEGPLVAVSPRRAPQHDQARGPQSRPLRRRPGAGGEEPVIAAGDEEPAAVQGAGNVLGAVAEGGHNDGRVADGDRKSTRLNSSHLVISYAVFCLKKKKN